MKRLRLSHVSGEIDVEIPSGTSPTTIESAAFADTRIPTIASPYILPIIVGEVDGTDLPEIMWIVAHTSGEETATVWRQAEYSATVDTGAGPARVHEVGTQWRHGPTPRDFADERVQYSHTDAADSIPLSTNTLVILGADVEVIDPSTTVSVANLIFVQPSSGSTYEYTSNTGITVLWIDGTPPVLSTTYDESDFIRLTRVDNNGLYWIGEIVGSGLSL